MAKRLDSPCIDICQLDPVTGLCMGCLRTIDEIMRWAQYSHQERQHVLKQLPARRAR